MVEAKPQIHDHLTVTPTGAALGAEISGVNLSSELSDSEFEQIEAAFHQHSVIFFRNQNLSPDRHVKFTKKFGEIEISPITQYALPSHPEVLLVTNVEENGKPIGLADAGRFWHSDISYIETPPRCSILHAKEVPFENGKSLGETHFVSTAAAFDDLDDGIKQKAIGLKAIHSFRHKKRAADTKRDAITRRDQQKERPNVLHPVIRTHPVTGRKCIYVASDGECIGIEGLPDAEALTLIDYLANHCIQEKFKYRHQWQVGDVLMWDNCSVQHKAIKDFDLPLRRLMHRTTVNGTRPV